MVVKLKFILFKLFVKLNAFIFYKKKWSKGNLKKILIEVNNPKQKNEWEKRLYSVNLSDYQVIFVKNRFLKANLLPDANYVFTNGVSKFINLHNSKTDFVYFSYRGVDSSLIKRFPSHIRFYTPEGISSDSIPEYCITLLLSIKWKLNIIFKRNYFHIWSQKKLFDSYYQRFGDGVVGVMGLGRNGVAIAKIFNSFGFKVYGYDKIKSSTNYIDAFYEKKSLNEFLSRIDILIIAVPLTHETKYMLNSETLSHLKNDIVIINVARGKVIKEDDLIVFAKNNKAAKIILDVQSNEPLRFYSDLWYVKNIFITPHISGNINLFYNKLMSDFIAKINYHV